MKGIPLLVALSAAVGHASAQNDMIAVEWPGDSYHVSSTTGMGTLLGPSGFTDLNAMARSGSRYYAGGQGGDLITIHPNTGVGAYAVTTAPLLASIRGMATIRDGSGLIYAIESAGSVTTDDELHTIVPSTGATAMIGTTTGFPGLQGLAFDLDGTLYSYDVTGPGLVTIDPDTAATTDVNPLVGSPVSIQCLAISETGVLYGSASSNLYRINKTTGAAVLVGAGPYTDLRGIEFRRGPNVGNWRINEVYTGVTDFVELINAGNVPASPTGISLWSFETRGNTVPCAPPVPPLGLNRHYTVPPTLVLVPPGGRFVIREGTVPPACGVATGENIFWFEASDVICWISTDSVNPRGQQIDMVSFGDIHQHDDVTNTYDSGSQWVGVPVCRANSGCDSIYRPGISVGVAADTDSAADWRFARGIEASECMVNPPLLPNPLTYGRGFRRSPANCFPLDNLNLATELPTLTISDCATFSTQPGATWSLTLQTGLVGPPPIVSCVAFNFVGTPPAGIPIPFPGCGGARAYVPLTSPTVCTFGGPGGMYNAGPVLTITVPMGFPGLQLYFQGFVLDTTPGILCPVRTTNAVRVTL